MAFWSDHTLRSRLPILISPYDPNLVDINAYTLTMGWEYYCTSDGRRSRLKRLLDKFNTKRTLTPGQSFVIPPGQFAFLQTAEKVNVPSDAMAFISIKARIKFEGLINVSGFHVDPGYNGYLVFSVYNAGPSDIHLDQGQKLFLIWYASLDKPNDDLKKPDDNKTISHDLIKGMSREILSLQSLSNDLAKIRNQMKVLRTLFAVAATVLVAVIIGVTNDAVHSFLYPKHEQTAQITSKPAPPKKASPPPQKPVMKPRGVLNNGITGGSP